MESNVCVCILDSLPDQSDSSTMAQKALVSGSTAIVHCKSIHKELIRHMTKLYHRDYTDL